MPLFTDGPINQAIQLQDYESSILEVASTEKIDLGVKAALAQTEIASELTLFLLRHRRRQRDCWGTIRRTVGMSDVVVSDSLRQWHAYKTLALVYRDAFNNQLNDRFKGKWGQCDALAKSIQQQYLQIGVGLVADPIVKAGVPAVTTVAGPGTAGTYYVAMTWVNQGGEEGSPSDATEITVETASQLVVTTGSAPLNAAGWNVYAGESPLSMARQNPVLLALGATWSPDSSLVQGIAPGDGQKATRFISDERVIERG